MQFNPHEYKVFQTEGAYMQAGNSLRGGGGGHFATYFTGYAKLNKPLQRFDDEMSNAVSWKRVFVSPL